MSGASPFDLSGETAVVTGANAGIGQAIALALARAGADVIAVGRSDPAETGESVRAAGRRFWSVTADLGAPGAAKVAAAQALACAPVGILVNNAGIIRRADAVDVTEADWDEVVDLNLKSAFFLTQALGRPMLERGRGKVINVASLLSFQGGVRVASYTAAKSGLAGLTRLLANEWASRGVNVNAIAPGYVETRNTAALRADPVRDAAILGRIPAGRWGRPDDIGGAAVFLASAASDYVSGVTLPVDGGWMAR